MSGIYIPDMELPKEYGCVYVLYPNGEVLGGAIVYHAIPVLDHGDLIDREPLGASIKESIDECHKWADEVTEGEMYARVSQALGTFVECSLRVKAAPTIIPSDKDGGWNG